MGAIQSAIIHWEHIAPVLMPPKTEQDYDNLIADLDAVLDAGGAGEHHPLASLADRMGDLVERYDNEHYVCSATGIDALKLMMTEHGLSQSGLPEIGSQGVVSEILNGKRELNVRQIRLLAKRFHVAEQVFI